MNPFLKQFQAWRPALCHRATLSVALTIAIPVGAFSQGANTPPGERSKFPCPENEIAHYTAYRVGGPIKIDGHLDEPSWTNAPWSPRFHDILTGGRTIHDTRACVTWDDNNLYVAYRVEEPFVHARFTNHNAHIYQDNDVEFFLAGRDAYYEFEINAFNTTYEVFFIWEEAYASGGFSKLPEFEKSKLRPFNGVGMNDHPRGKRLANFKWDFPGLKTAVAIDGTVNKDDDRDRGWTVEIAFPWKGLETLALSDHRALPPKDGDVWRMDFSRFNTYKEAPPAKDSGGWVWSKHGVWDSHIPECFPYIRFSTNTVANSRSSDTTKP
ncbi:MAG: polyhydroxyalkanoate depolymerase [Pedosphaera sp.]|nr:polyhydroxyalkanoate depolymerase [Pedosphaera sp.]